MKHWVECPANLLDLFHTSILEKEHRQHLEKGGLFKKDLEGGLWTTSTHLHLVYLQSKFEEFQTPPPPSGPLTGFAIQKERNLLSQHQRAARD